MTLKGCGQECTNTESESAVSVVPSTQQTEEEEVQVTIEGTDLQARCTLQDTLICCEQDGFEQCTFSIYVVLPPVRDYNDPLVIELSSETWRERCIVEPVHTYPNGRECDRYARLTTEQPVLCEPVD